MAEYIEREAVLSKVDKAFKLFDKHRDIIRFFSDVRSSVIYAHAADVAPVRHGRWYDKGALSCRCSEYGCKSNRESNYCPNCGSLMKEADHEAG